ncbi:MAG: VanZ family protein [Eubacterium sp.]|nr:VanZ family protein [Eubacterium sp.]
MERFIKTLSENARNYCKEYLLATLIIAILTLLIYIIISKIKKQKISKSKAISLLAFSSYFSLMLNISLIHRIGTEIDKTANIFDEWSIFDVESSMYLNLKPIYNVILFLPMCFVLFFFIKSFFNKAYGSKRLLIYSTVISFSTSLFIELTQLIFNLGTFQLSDLVYNTTGGLIGALTCIIIRKITNKKMARVK